MQLELLFQLSSKFHLLSSSCISYRLPVRRHVQLKLFCIVPSWSCTMFIMESTGRTLFSINQLRSFHVRLYSCFPCTFGMCEASHFKLHTAMKWKQTRNISDFDQIHSKFSKMAPAAILDSIETEIASFDPPTPKTRTKHDVDPMTRCGDIAIRNFPNERSVGRLFLSLTLISYRPTPLRYIRTVARKNWLFDLLDQRFIQSYLSIFTLTKKN